MKPLIIANFEAVEATKFIVAQLYSEDGQLRDGITLPCDSCSDALFVVRHLAETNRILTAVEMWTSNTGLYLESLKDSGVLGVIKHPSDTISTRRAIDQDADMLRDIYDIIPLNPEPTKPKPPKWRAFLILTMRKILNHLEENGKYEI